MTQLDPSGGQYDPYGQLGQPPPYPAGQGPYGYAPYHVPYATAAPRRPTSVLVLAIFGIIFGGLGLLSPLTPLLYVVRIGPPNPVLQLTHDDPVLWAWTLASSFAGFPVAVAQLAGSIGILKLRPWARKMLLWWAWVDIVLALVAAGVTFGLIVPKMLAFQNTSNDPVVRMGVMSGVGGAVVGIPFAFILPVCTLFFLTRPKVKAAFAPPAAPGAGGA
jgi:hypothetical protein